MPGNLGSLFVPGGALRRCERSEIVTSKKTAKALNDLMLMFSVRSLLRDILNRREMVPLQDETLYLPGKRLDI